MTDAHILAIDLGTSGPKTALISTRGQVVSRSFESVSLNVLPAGGAEQDPNEWWTAIIKAAKNALAQGSVSLDTIVAVGVTAQYCGTVPVDNDGKPLMNAIIWMDSRGAPYVKDVTSGLIEAKGYGIWKLFRWLRLTGGAPSLSGKDALAHILWIMNMHPELYCATAKFLEPKDYINYKLTGERFCTVDSVTTCWLTDNRNLAHVVYDSRLLATTGIDREKLPEIRYATDVIGMLTEEVTDTLGLPRRLPVVGGAPDLHSAAIGSGAVADYEGHIYIGTSSWISCHVPFKKTSLFDNIASIPSAIPNRYLVGTEQEAAGACLSFLRDRILFEDEGSAYGVSSRPSYRMLDEIAARAPAGSDGVIFTPWLYGERTPVADYTVRSGFINLSMSTNRDRIARAVFEGVAYNNRWLLEAVERFIRRRFSTLRFIGGGANSELWCQILADVLNRPILQVADPSSANLRGAAFLSAVALGLNQFEQLASTVEIAAKYTPDSKNQTRYEKLFKAYLRFYRKNHDLYADLNANELNP